MDRSLSSRRGPVSVLSCFPPPVGRDVAIAVLKPLRAAVGNPNRHSLLHTDRQVRWTMEVLCYGLTLPLEGNTVRLCVDVYTDWLTALVSPRDSIPPPISREPNLYVQKILQHLYSLFLPRSDQVSPVYLYLYQQVLCAVRSMARESSMMSRDTWESLLLFLLRINHAMLAPPTAAGDLSQLSMEVLLEVWLLSCARCFPSRCLWQTCGQALSGWRHQPVVVEQWSRVVAALTSRLLLLSFGPSFPRLKVPDVDAALIPADLDDGWVPETWFRILHMFSNPVDLTRPSQEELLSRRDGRLPNMFFRAMREVSTLVDAFLGVTVVNKEPTEQLLPIMGTRAASTYAGLTARIHFRDRLPSLGVAVTRSPFKDHLPSYGISRPRSGSAPPTPVNILSMPSAPPYITSPPLHKRQLKPTDVSKTTIKPPMMTLHHHWKSSSHPATHTPPLSTCSRPSPSPLRCNVDSLLHLFGSWLFDAALINRDSASESDVPVISERWASGQAEACGTLCRIFSCKKTSEDVLPVYLSRFYQALLQGLQVWEGACLPVLASILLNSTCLFCCDLTGINLLLPSFVSALEIVLLDSSRELLRFKGFVSLVDLRRASIQVMLSLLPLPLQFGSIRLEVLPDSRFSGDNVTAGSFLGLKPRLLSVLIGALQTETDASNTQVILAAMLNLVLDSAVVQASGQASGQAQKLGESSLSKWTSGTSTSRRTTGTTVQSNEAGVLWVQVVRLLTQRLTAHWKNEAAVCLSALEVLGGLAKVEVRVEEAERRRAISSVCSYIVFQCSRPPPLHSRDLHSIIVTAFYCLNVWLTQHPAVLNHQDCLLEVLEIVELGLSGSKSRQEQEVRCKEEKDLTPVSLRVKEAAEVTLSCVMQVSGIFRFDEGSLNEDALIGLSGLDYSSLKKFRYFVVDSSVILGILEQPPGPENAWCPSLTVLIRGPSGCRTWTLQLHLQPREDRRHTQQTLIAEPHGIVQEDYGIQCGSKYQLFPESINRVPLVKADLSIPPLNKAVSEEVQKQLEHLRTVLKKQRQFETQPHVSSCPVFTTTHRPPPPVSNCQTARLFLSHLGLLTPETLKDPGTSGVPAQLVALDLSLPGFSEDLRHLDQLSSRTCDSAFVLYMRAGQRTSAEILRNVESSCSVPSHFLDFLSSLGQPVEASHHQGRGISSSRPEFPAVLGNSGGSVFNGEKFVLKFTDVLTEITFIVPSSSSSSSSSSSAPHKFDWLKRLEEAGQLTESQSNLQRQLSQDSESKVLIVWVELFEDIDFFPLSDLLSDMTTQTPTSSSNILLIFIHPLKTGLYRICCRRKTTSKFSIIVPLVSGSVVSKRCLGFLVRETVINCCHRRWLESDSAPPPHIRRKHMISDMILRYCSRRSEPAFYSSLFHSL
ncbi:ral GTPase-activating protein subunit beta-like isoform X2 [Anabas testudineus]|uniref:ral GTPase-activating protein subunit beta-like isoform X2 n=1 Tax=Anabas testudineus TaxID=64144 RepID=UPI000E45E504|nr:ral GTPase-activating protein subunit beta-like isoform X2 [Anabas testudineus]